MKLRVLAAAAFAALISCGGETTGPDHNQVPIPRGKADSFVDGRRYEVLLTDPHCDVCDGADKDHLLANSEIVARVIELIDGAQRSIDVAQFTFSRQNIEEALLRAHRRGVIVKLAMNASQADGDNPSTRLAEAGIPVEFVKGRNNGSYAGLQHAKYMVVDAKTVLLGSNNWSSTGVSINDENTIVVSSSEEDPFVGAFRCYFDKMLVRQPELGAICSTEEVAFTPGSGAWKVLRDEIRSAQSTIDVLMHHLVFDDAVKELAKAAENGVRVRVVLNAADIDEARGSDWDRLRAAGGEIRYKKTNGDLYQIMHNKLAVFDGRVMINGSGNWSGSAFFNNWEFYVRYERPDVVDPFENLFDRLWTWSLTSESLEAGLTAREQDFVERRVFFGNLHAHLDLKDGDQVLDDGRLEREIDGELVDVTPEAAGNPVLHALDYARARGGLDFIALTPHVQDDVEGEDPNIANMSADAFAQMLSTIDEVNARHEGTFAALGGLEWSTNSAGNHVNVIGTRELSKVVRGDFSTFYEGYLPVRREAGDPAWVMFNHPRTFQYYEGVTNGSWDQIYGINLLEIESNSERSKKFNDYGLDDFLPLRDVRQSWIDGAAMPDPAVVSETLHNIADLTSAHARLFEVTIARGSDLGSEEAQNPSLTVDEETNEVTRFVKVHSDWDYYLRHGFRLAPTASHDNHLANWGTGHTSRTAVIADELSERGILDAIGARSVFASEDENLAIRYYANDLVPSGGELTILSDTVSLQFHLADPDFDGPFEVAIWGGTVGGDEVAVVERLEAVSGGEWVRVDVPVASPGVHFFYLEILEPEPNRMAWTAPIWVERP